MMMMMMMMKSSGSSSTDAIHIKAVTIFLKRPLLRLCWTREEKSMYTSDCLNTCRGSPVRLDLFSTAQIQRSQQG
jgi:hypothetical protein